MYLIWSAHFGPISAIWRGRGGDGVAPTGNSIAVSDADGSRRGRVVSRGTAHCVVLPRANFRSSGQFCEDGG